MKKTYINPELEVIKIATQQMLASSTLTIDDSIQITDESDLLAPGFGFEDEFDLTDNDDLGLFNN